MSYDETKFKEFNRMLKEATGVEGVIIPHPEVLGDTYDELVENLNRLADADKVLSIVPRDKRTGV